MAQHSTQDMIPAICTKSYCKLCHGDRPQIKDATTEAARSRNIAIYYDQKQKMLQSSTSKLAASKAPASSTKLPGTGFLDLPPEIRIQVYGLCLVDANQCIVGAVEGGGMYPDFSQNDGDFRLWVDHRFSTTLLLANKFIYMEAREELYRLI